MAASISAETARSSSHRGWKIVRRFRCVRRRHIQTRRQISDECNSTTMLKSDWGMVSWRPLISPALEAFVAAGDKENTQRASRESEAKRRKLFTLHNQSEMTSLTRKAIYHRFPPPWAALNHSTFSRLGLRPVDSRKFMLRCATYPNRLVFASTLASPALSDV